METHHALLCAPRLARVPTKLTWYAHLSCTRPIHAPRQVLGVAAGEKLHDEAILRFMFTKKSIEENGDMLRKHLAEVRGDGHSVRGSVLQSSALLTHHCRYGCFCMCVCARADARSIQVACMLK